MLTINRWPIAIVVLLATATGGPTAQAPSPAGVLTPGWGDPIDAPAGGPAQRRAPADFDGDGASDVGVFRPGDRQWLLRSSSTGGGLAVTWGEPEDVPVPADYDGDGRADIAVFRPSNATWYIWGSTLGPITLPFGIGSDQPVPADYDGDGKADLAVFRVSTGSWFAIHSSTGTLIGLTWGGPADLPTPGD